MEIGSEYSLQLSDFIIKKDNLYQYLTKYNTLFLDSGRSCLQYLSNALEEGTILLPEFVCESVVSAFSNRKIIFYKINDDLSIDMSDLMSKIDSDVQIVLLLLLLHYFGSIQSKEILSKIAEIRDKYQLTIIEDTTQSIFSEINTIGDYCVCSLRKWFPIPDGGVLYSKKELPRLTDCPLQKNTHIDKINPFILKQLYLDNIISNKSEYRELFIKCEEMLDTRDNIFLLSDISSYLLSCVNISEIIKKRKENYSHLMTNLHEWGIDSIINIKDTDCPFVFPMYVPNRDTFRRELISQNIYCAVHWPIPECFRSNHISKVLPTTHAWDISANIISLPIDQRYGKEEMDYLISAVIKYYANGEKT